MAGIRIRKVNHVAYPISDRKKTLPFYRDVLGLKVIPSMVDNANVIWTQMGDGSMVHPIEPGADGRPATFHAAFEVEDFDAAFAALQEAGVNIESHGERHDGQRFLFIRDPDGNRIELTTGSGLKPHNRTTDEWGYTKGQGT